MRTLRAWNPEYAPVFISYAHVDSERVKRIVDDLRAAGVRVLGDWDFKIGDSLLQRIRQGISRAGFLIVALSRASIASEWVNRELRLAVEGEVASKSVKVLPALIEDCVIPDFLGKDRLWADFRLDNSDGLKRVLEVIRTAGSC
jgi:TIR domain